LFSELAISDARTIDASHCGGGVMGTMIAEIIRTKKDVSHANVLKANSDATTRSK